MEYYAAVFGPYLATNINKPERIQQPRNCMTSRQDALVKNLYFCTKWLRSWFKLSIEDHDLKKIPSKKSKTAKTFENY